MRDTTYPDGARDSWSVLIRDLVRIAADALRARRDALAEMRRLEGELDRQAQVIRRQAAALRHSRKIIDRSSLQAKIGVWECELPSGRLTWTDGTYDLFELPRGTPITREMILAFYDPTSVETLTALRDRAIAECGQFGFEARITTARGRTRWIRITASVETEEGRPVRLFGMKQDVSDERALMERLRTLAEHDPLTGLINRTRLEAALDGAARGTLLLLDLDGFKEINDTYGHAAGDACLREVAARLRAASPTDAQVARLGGDEFAILVADEMAPSAIAAHGDALLTALREPITVDGIALEIGASIGASRLRPAEGTGRREALVDADLALYAAKRAGKGTCSLSPRILRAQHEAEEVSSGR